MIQRLRFAITLLVGLAPAACQSTADGLAGQLKAEGSAEGNEAVACSQAPKLSTNATPVERKAAEATWRKACEGSAFQLCSCKVEAATCAADLTCKCEDGFAECIDATATGANSVDTGAVAAAKIDCGLYPSYPPGTNLATIAAIELKWKAVCAAIGTLCRCRSESGICSAPGACQCKDGFLTCGSG